MNILSLWIVILVVIKLTLAQDNCAPATGTCDCTVPGTITCTGTAFTTIPTRASFTGAAGTVTSL